jgi:catechol 2,3-dioxygenase-like lactoylglutathione lyase family enzyme
VLPGNAQISDAKWLHTSNNALGSELAILLDRLTAAGFLEKREEPDCRYRVAPDFRARFAIEDVGKQREPDAALKLLVLRCADVERSRRFYEAIGQVFVREQHDGGPVHYSTHLGEVVLELYPRTTSTVAVRVGIAVPDVRSVVSAAQALEHCVSQFDPEKESAFAVLRDPDGNKVELTCFAR